MQELKVLPTMISNLDGTLSLEDKDGSWRLSSYLSSSRPGFYVYWRLSCGGVCTAAAHAVFVLGLNNRALQSTGMSIPG